MGEMTIKGWPKVNAVLISVPKLLCKSLLSSYVTLQKPNLEIFIGLDSLSKGG